MGSECEVDMSMDRYSDSPVDLKITPLKQNLSPKANAFSIAAILGREKSLDCGRPTETLSPSRLSDNSSPRPCLSSSPSSSVSSSLSPRLSPITPIRSESPLGK